jgi:uncharacterized protein YqeY
VPSVVPLGGTKDGPAFELKKPNAVIFTKGNKGDKVRLPTFDLRPLDLRLLHDLSSFAEPSRQLHRDPQGESMPSLYDTIRADIITAMKARDKETTLVLRTLDAAIKRAAMDTNQEIDEALALATLRKTVKDLTGANEQFAKGGRDDLVAKNDAEIAILNKYLPKALDPAKVEALVDAAIQQTGATSKKEMGKVIGALKQLPEAAVLDFGVVSKLVQGKLV